MPRHHYHPNEVLLKYLGGGRGRIVFPLVPVSTGPTTTFHLLDETGDALLIETGDYLDFDS